MYLCIIVIFSKELGDHGSFSFKQEVCVLAVLHNHQSPNTVKHRWRRLRMAASLLTLSDSVLIRINIQHTLILYHGSGP
jgi:hypothetical protein